MNRFLKWWKAAPTVKHKEISQIEPVTIESVSPAPVPDRQIDAETKALRTDMARALRNLSNRSYDLRMALGEAAIKNMEKGAH